MIRTRRPFKLARYVGLAGMCTATCGAAAPVMRHVGDTVEIRIDRESADQGDDGSSGSTTDRDALIERVVAVSEAGIDLEYDLTPKASQEERAADWHFPVRVRKAPNGPLQLLNRTELEARIDPWLKSGGMTRAACGHWIFTWNAFRIDCDPQSILVALERDDMGSDKIYDGAAYRHPDASIAATLHKPASGAGMLLVAELPIDPETIRREEAERDVTIGEIMRMPVSLESALRFRASEEIAGTISVTFDLDSTGTPRRRTTFVSLRVKDAAGHHKTRTVKEIVERRAVHSDRRASGGSLIAR